MASRGGLLLAVLWALSLGLVFLLPLALPAGKGGAFFSFAGLEPERAIDWLDLYIPANPFRSLANNVVPAVVVFAVLAGVGLMALPRKQVLLEPLHVFNEAMGRVGSLLARLTPFGIFAIAGNTAGTMQLDEFGRLQGFVLTYAVFACLLTFWLLPGLVAALTPVSHRRMVAISQDALVTAFVTSNLFIVLPILVERSRALLAERRAQDGATDGEREDELVDVLVPTSFNFPHGAKVLSIGFVLFAGWYAGVEIPAARYPALAGAGLLAVFGSINTAIPFLLDLVRVPADLFQLFVVSGVLNSRFGAMTSAMHTLVVAVLGTCLITGRIEVRRARLVRYLAVSALLVAAAVLGSRALLGLVMPEPAAGGGASRGPRPPPPARPRDPAAHPAASARAGHAARHAPGGDPRERKAARRSGRGLGAVGLREREGRGRGLRRRDGPLARPPARGPPRVRAPAAGPRPHPRGPGQRCRRPDHVRHPRFHPQRRPRGLLAALRRGGGGVPRGGPPARGVRPDRRPAREASADRRTARPGVARGVEAGAARGGDRAGVVDPGVRREEDAARRDAHLVGAGLRVEPPLPGVLPGRPRAPPRTDGPGLRPPARRAGARPGGRHLDRGHARFRTLRFGAWVLGPRARRHARRSRGGRSGATCSAGGRTERGLSRLPGVRGRRRASCPASSRCARGSSHRATWSCASGGPGSTTRTRWRSPGAGRS